MFCSGTDELNQKLVERMQALYPELPLYVVAEFLPEAGTWIPYHVNRSLADNLARCRAAIRGKRIRLAGVLLVPAVPYRRMRLMALMLSPAGFLAFNENLDSFMLRPRCARAIVLHALWRVRNFLRWQLRPGGRVYTFLWRLRHPREFRVPAAYRAGLAAGWLRAGNRRAGVRPLATDRPSGVSVVVPSRNGRRLLETQLPGIVREEPSEIIVVDNGSDDGTAEFLASAYPHVMVESSREPLSFARAANRGIARARFSHVCLLNNDMIVEPGFFAALRAAFEEVPGLFCASAQILFPPGQRREETGKTVMARSGPEEFPVRCDIPLEGEDLSYVLYGSGGCSLYDAEKLRALGGVSEIYEPAYVEDLDLGYRAWQRGWPSVFVAEARVEHRHRATTSRYFTSAQISGMLETNYLRFLCSAVASRTVFRRLWRQALWRLRLLAVKREPGAVEALGQAARIALENTTPAESEPEDLFLALTGGEVAVFPGRPASSKPVVLVAAPWLPFPLAHGGAVRIYNLMRRAAADFDLVLVAFSDRLVTPPAELLEICAEVVVVRRKGSHSLPATGDPQDVEEFRSAAFRAVLRQTIRKWRPAVAQLELTVMAQYARDCAPARTVLVEHDITFDLYEQLLAQRDDWETRRQLDLWRRFETAAWRRVDAVVTMSERDRRVVAGPRVVTLANGVDIERFQPSPGEPERGRLLFIGSFAHLPNLLALDFFLREVWPALGWRHPARHRGSASRLFPAALRGPRGCGPGAAGDRARGIRRGRAARLPARRTGDRATGGLGRNQHQDSRSDGNGEGDCQHAGGNQRAGRGKRGGAGAERRRDGGGHPPPPGRRRRQANAGNGGPPPRRAGLQLGAHRGAAGRALPGDRRQSMSH